jgi:hypothetical protein
LGARTIPIVARDGRFVSAQVIRDVVDFLGLDDDTKPQLNPTQLAQRYTLVLEKAVSLVAQMPDEHLSKELPNRPRSWLVLMHHMFQIPNAFLDMEDTGETLTYESLVAQPPEGISSSAAVAAFGANVQTRFAQWWERSAAEDFDAEVPTYFGGTTRHEMFERTVWHSTQHTRQVASLLEQVGIAPTAPLLAEDLAGLPLTPHVWDE